MRRGSGTVGAAGLGARLCAVLAAAALLAATPLDAPSGAALAQEGEDLLGAAPQDDALAELFEQLRRNEADPHLPFILSRLKRALADQDLLGVLELLDPAYFNAQFAAQSGAPGRTPGEAMGAFACELFSICDVSKSYGFNDIVSAKVLAVSPAGGLTGGPVEITLELRMWDGLSVVSTLFYDTGSAKLSGAVG